MAKALKPGETAAIIPELGNLFMRTKGAVVMYGFLPVMFMCIGSALLMVVVSLLTRPPSQGTIAKFFPGGKAIGALPPAGAAT